MATTGRAEAAAQSERPSSAAIPGWLGGLGLHPIMPIRFRTGPT